MKLFIVGCVVYLVIAVDSIEYENVTLLYDPASRQLLEYKLQHPNSKKLWTSSSGSPIEIRETKFNGFFNKLHLDNSRILYGERIPERIFNAKGIGAFGYFEVTNNVSQYTSADVFNDVGKKTPVVIRFTTAVQNAGGSDLAREFKSLSVKFYTEEGNFDLLTTYVPVFLIRDPVLFPYIVRTFKRNPKTNLFDFTALFDLVTHSPSFLHCVFWIMSDYGLPNGYRKMDTFAIHTFEIVNKYGETHYVRFNFRTEQGFAPLTSAQAAEIQALDLDYFTRDLYNSIENKDFPAWRLEMDVMTRDDLSKVDYDPFDITRLWKNGTYSTVPIGRLVLNRNVENHFRDTEQLAFSVSNLVPGIEGPVDDVYRAASAYAYSDAQSHRLGRNYNNILVNQPLYANNYKRDGAAPISMNGRDSPNYYPNSFNGPMPYVDEKRPKKLVILESNAVDLEPAWYFYNYVIDNEAHRQRFITNIAMTLVPVTPPVFKNVLDLLYLIDKDLGMRVSAVSTEARQAAMAARDAAAAAPKPPVVNVNIAQNSCS